MKISDFKLGRIYLVNTVDGDKVGFLTEIRGGWFTGRMRLMLSPQRGHFNGVNQERMNPICIPIDTIISAEEFEKVN